MTEQGRDDAGRYTATVTDNDLLNHLQEHGPSGTQDIADALGIGYDATYKRLRKLEESGKIESDRIANARLWKLST